MAELRITNLTDEEKAAARDGAERAIEEQRRIAARRVCEHCGAEVYRPMFQDELKLERRPAVAVPDARRAWRVAGDGQHWKVQVSSQDECIYLEHVCPDARAELNDRQEDGPHG